MAPSGTVHDVESLQTTLLQKRRTRFVPHADFSIAAVDLIQSTLLLTLIIRHMHVS